MNNIKINLIIFHPYSAIGGADLSLSKLINNLDNNIYKIDFICLNNQKISKYIKKKIKIHIIKSTKTIFSIFKVRKIIKSNIKKDYKKIIFISNQNFVNILSYFITLNLNDKIKKIGIERNHLSELYFYKNLKDLILKYIIKLLIKFTYKKFDTIVGNSKELSFDLSKFSKTKVKTIYNPLILSKKNKTNLYKKKNKNTILNVGRLEKQKDQKTLIKAMYFVNKEIDVNLIIIGYGSEFNRLKKMIKKYGLEKKIKILTNKNKLDNYYNSCDLFVLSSLYEGFPNVIAESILHDMPVISSNCKSGPKEILLGSKGDNFFEIGNYIELSKKIINYFKNSDTLKKKSKKIKKSLKRFDIKIIMNQYNKLFLKI